MSPSDRMDGHDTVHSAARALYSRQSTENRLKMGDFTSKNNRANSEKSRLFSCLNLQLLKIC